MSNRRDNQFTWNPHNKATILDCSFKVDSTNVNGFGISSLQRSGRIGSVFMHTTQTAGKADNGLTNPNPLAGYINVTLQDNYNTYLAGDSQVIAPLSGTPVSISAGLTLHKVYVITSLGTTTQAQWQAVGLPSYVKAAVGVSFIASTASAGSGTGVVQALATAGSGVDHIELASDPNLENSTGANVQSLGVGMTINLACFAASVLTAPADGTIIKLWFYLNNSAQGV